MEEPSSSSLALSYERRQPVVRFFGTRQTLIFMRDPSEELFFDW